MTVLQVADLGFGYGANRLFSGITFTLEPGQRAALVAPNGAGKSTLLRLIGKEIQPDQGTVVVKRDTRVAYARQSHELPPVGSVMEAFMSGFGRVLDARAALAAAQHAAADGSKEALDRLVKATDAYHLAGGDELERRVTIIAQHLGFTDADLERPLSSLSGGERGRLHLGIGLAQEPGLLLLDEPTNHLDLDTIGWLEKHLVTLSCAMVIVSHDRAFLDAVCPITMELGRRSFRFYPLPFSAYEAAREEDLARENELAERQQAFVAKTEDFIRKNIAGQKTKQAQSRRKMLEKLETIDRPEDVWQVAEKVRFRFAPAPRTGDIVLEATGLGATRGDRRLFDAVDLLVRRGERIAIVGPNGSGKSTLLKLLAGLGGADDDGDVRRGTNLAQGYFDQHLGSLDPERTAVEEVRSVRADLNVDGARQYLARFRIWGDDSLRKVSGFSGGERSRLALAKLLLEPRNLLFLDEPTNHLDIPAAEILEEALTGFEGTVVFVSHDRRFLDGVATRVLSLREGQIEIYPGGFADYREATARALAAAARAEREAKEAPPPAAKARAVKKSASTRPPEGPNTDDPVARRRAFEAERAAQRAFERKRRRVKELEGEIEKGEAELETRRETLKQDPGGDWAKLADLAKQEQLLAKRLEAAIAEWAALSDELAAAPSDSEQAAS